MYRAELLWHEDDRAAFEIECSAGTYVRTLVTDLGDAYCDELERTAIGPFRLADSDPERLVPLDTALAFLPERALEAPDAVAVSHGRGLPVEAGGDAPGEPYVRLTHEGRLLAIAERGLEDRVEIRLQDYREVPERDHFDAVGSLEMGEHVGEGQYPVYAGILFGALKPTGRLLLQQMSRHLGTAPGGGAFIESYIAPDMHMRPLSRTLEHLQNAGFEVR